MALTINTNIASLTAQKNLAGTQSTLQTAMQRLSSGLRINSSADDAAGLAIAARFTAQVNGTNQAVLNANDATSLAQTGDSALQSISDNLQRIRTLAVEAANSTSSASDRAALQSEVAQRVAEIDRVASQTSFNSVNLLDGTFQGQQFQVGANVGQTIQVSNLASARSGALGASFTASLAGGAITFGTAFASGDLTLQVGSNIVSVGAAVNGTNGRDNSSAYSIANAINAVSSGVTATAASNVWTNAAVATGGGVGNAGTFTVNGALVTVTAGELTGVAATDTANMISDIQAVSAVSGVTASNDGANHIVLTAADGRNVSVSAITTASGLTAAMAGIGTFVGATNHTSTISLSSSSSFTIAGANPTHAGAGVTPQTVAAAATGTAMSNVDISTVGGANTAITSVDAALTAVNSERAQLGAYMNRFQSVVANLQSTSTNLAAARSQIQDADFAAETANFTRAQILQQAGTAMLAQANSLPNSVLSLLK